MTAFDVLGGQNKLLYYKIYYTFTKSYKSSITSFLHHQHNITFSLIVNKYELFI